MHEGLREVAAKSQRGCCKQLVRPGCGGEMRPRVRRRAAWTPTPIATPAGPSTTQASRAASKACLRCASLSRCCRAGVTSRPPACLPDRSHSSISYSSQSIASSSTTKSWPDTCSLASDTPSVTRTPSPAYHRRTAGSMLMSRHRATSLAAAPHPRPRRHPHPLRTGPRTIEHGHGGQRQCKTSPAGCSGPRRHAAPEE